jgi:hypothetical protein
MKRLLIATALLVALLTPMTVMAAGSCADPTTVSYGSVREIAFVCTGDSAAGTFPAVIWNKATMDLINGWYLMTGSVLNGATGMTANSTLTLSTAREGDILGGAGKGPTAATAALQSKFAPIKDTTLLVAGLVPITDTLTLQITQAGSAVNSAVATIVFKFVK